MRAKAKQYVQLNKQNNNFEMRGSALYRMSFNNSHKKFHTKFQSEIVTNSQLILMQNFNVLDRLFKAI